MSEEIDPNVDGRLEPPTITTVLFDIGGVLFQPSDGPLFKKMARVINRSPDDIYKAIYQHPHVADVFAGKVPEEEFLRYFYHTLNLPFPEDIEEARTVFDHPEVFLPQEGMQGLVQKLIDNGIEVAVLTDTISPLAALVRSRLLELYPQIRSDRIFISSEIGVAKREKNAPAFRLVLEKLGVVAENIVFVDDVLDYTAAAQSIYGMHSFTFEEYSSHGVSAAASMKEELKKLDCC